MGQSESCHANADAKEMTAVQRVDQRLVGLGDGQSRKATTTSFLPNLLPAKENVNLEIAQKDAGAWRSVEVCPETQEEVSAHTGRTVLSEVQATASPGANTSSLASAAVASAAESADAARRKQEDVENYLEHMRRARSAAWRRSQRPQRNKRMQPYGIASVEQLHWSVAVTKFSRWAPGDFTNGEDHYHSPVYGGGANPPLPYAMSIARDVPAEGISVQAYRHPDDMRREAFAIQGDIVEDQEYIQSPKRSANPHRLSSIFSTAKVESLQAAVDEVQSPKPTKDSRSSSRNSNDFRTSCEHLQDVEKPFVHTARKKVPRFHGSL